MAVVEAIAPMTTEQLLALPDDGVERWLIRGQLRAKPMTYRNRFHSRAMVRVGYALEAWLNQQPQPRGSVLGGEAGVRLRRDPDTTVGIDVVYISAELAARQSDDTTLIDGVPLVWIIDPRDRTVTIYRPDQEPELVNVHQELSGEPHLPGFRVAVADLFA